jgi:hypothetical protein
MEKHLKAQSASANRADGVGPTPDSATLKSQIAKPIGNAPILRRATFPITPWHLNCSFITEKLPAPQISGGFRTGKKFDNLLPALDFFRAPSKLRLGGPAKRTPPHPGHTLRSIKKSVPYGHERMGKKVLRRRYVQKYDPFALCSSTGP